MRSFTGLAFAAITLLVVAFSSPSHAAVGVVKPDLRIQSMGPSPYGHNYLRVKVVNAGFAPSGACVIRVWMSNWPSSALFAVPALPASGLLSSPTVTLDLYLGAALNQCGVFTTGAVDAFQQVSETQETNNTAVYYSHPC